MTQYFFADESGDAGLAGQASSSSHFVIAMIQLAERAPLQPLADLRKHLNVSPYFEFKYHKTTNVQKDRFFNEIMEIPFRARLAVLDVIGNKVFGVKTACFQGLFPINFLFPITSIEQSNSWSVVQGYVPARTGHRNPVGFGASSRRTGYFK